MSTNFPNSYLLETWRQGPLHLAPLELIRDHHDLFPQLQGARKAWDVHRAADGGDHCRAETHADTRAMTNTTVKCTALDPLCMNLKLPTACTKPHAWEQHGWEPHILRVSERTDVRPVLIVLRTAGHQIRLHTYTHNAIHWAR